MPGLDGLKKMADLMAGLREKPPRRSGVPRWPCRKDYQDGSAVDCATGAKSTMELSGSNVLRSADTARRRWSGTPSGRRPEELKQQAAAGTRQTAAQRNFRRAAGYR